MEIETQIAKEPLTVPPDEAPQNGLAGLKHWKQDMLAGLVVALVSIPLSLGIALASGAPPICGLTSEIIAGFIFPFLGGAYVTISGPAAGLAPVLYSSMAVLGKGDMVQGYKLITAVIIFAGLTQIVLTYLKAAKFSYLFPRAAVQGMLASIGLMIIAKQIPNFIGHKYQAHDFFPVLAETPHHILHLNPAVFLTSVICLALLFLIPKLKSKYIRYIPPHIFVVLAGIALAQAFHLESRFLVEIPANPLQHGIVMPDFAALFSDATLIPTIIFAVLALTFVDGTESLATIHAVDQIDPFNRKSNPHRTLFAMGISNICSGMVGGLTIIPGIIKSTTCIVSGGRTAWVNFYNAVFITAFLLVFHDVIRTIPIAALSAVLVHIGYKLAGPPQWQKMIDLGAEQLMIFTTTVLVTVCSDLLVGIGCGILMKVLILLHYSLKASMETGKSKFALIGSSLRQLFVNPVDKVETVDGETRVHFSGPLTCFNNLSVRKVIEDAFKDSSNVRVVIESKVVDHSSAMYLKQVSEESQRRGTFAFAIEGLDKLSGCSRHKDAFRYRNCLQ
ncbi:MAG: SulP family inorganic anion transporter [Cyanobacteria bacterium]|nr:SulP family inorganic anion transporter [Cyanobacteriota bacterium]